MDDADLIATLVDTHARWEAGKISTIEAAIEQLEVLMAIHHIPGGNQLIEALIAFQDGYPSQLDTIAITGKLICPDC
jgi:hypothetical protein